MIFHLIFNDLRFRRFSSNPLLINYNQGQGAGRGDNQCLAVARMKAVFQGASEVPISDPYGSSEQTPETFSPPVQMGLPYGTGWPGRNDTATTAFGVVLRNWLAWMKQRCDHRLVIRAKHSQKRATPTSATTR
jgi:hypothetical protein